MIKAKELLKSFNIPSDSKIIVAVSGGLDSMVLLTYLIEENYSPIVVHFNHNTRDTNKRDEGLIETFSKNHDLIYHIENIYVDKGNFQSKARDLRYDKLKEIANKYNTPYIATAHHLDDLAETVLIKLTRGSNLYGYAGIHPIVNKDDFIYIKPFLYTSKITLKEYQLFNEVPYFDDESNYTDAYLRNRYRHTVLPILKQENNQFLNKVLTYHQQLTNAYNYIKKQALLEITNNSFNVSKYKELDIAIQNEMIAILLSNHNLDSSYELIDKIRDMILSNNSNRSYTLKDELFFIKSYDKVYIDTKLTPLEFEQILKEGINVLPNNIYLTITDDTIKNNALSTEIWYNGLSLPLIARTRKPGDILNFSYGRKKLKDYLIDLKIPLVIRNELVIITDSDNEILWVSNIYTNETLGKDNKLKIIVGE